MGSELSPGWDEAWAAPGVPRPQYADLLDALDGVDLEQLSRMVAELMARDRATFGDEPFAVCPVPRVLAAAEWASLEQGLAQRTRALNRFLVDAYGAQEIVAAGVVPRQVLESAEGFEADLVERLPTQPFPAAIIGFDVVRDADGSFCVLEDNLRTPSGFAYAVAARAACVSRLPTGVPEPGPIEPELWSALRASLVAAAPGGEPDPRIVVLTDGEDNVAYYEHALAARRLGVELLVPGDLSVLDGTLMAGGEPIDVVYRRTNEDRVRDAAGALTPVGELLMEPWVSGRLGLINAFGNGVADDKLVHGHVEDFVRFYLGEEPLLRSVPTAAVADDLEGIVGRLASQVIKPRWGHGGHGVVIGQLADAAGLATLADELRADPGAYVAQPTVTLSVAPTVIDGRLAPRHVDLRAFVFAGTSGVSVLPGGLSRVAFDEGELVVNSSQNGGGKDTWVLPG